MLRVDLIKEIKYVTRVLVKKYTIHIPFAEKSVALISIKPNFVNQILSGDKKVELEILNVNAVGDMGWCT